TDREHSAQRRGRVEPAGQDVATGITGGYPTGGDRTGDGTQEERRDHRGERERGTESTAQRQLRYRLAERECRTGRDHPEGGQGQRQVQGGGDGRERGREAGPEHHEYEAQPDVVRLPHRAERVLDQAALSGPAPGTTGEQVAEPGPEVSAAEERIG